MTRRLLPLAAGAFVVATDGTLVVGLLRPIAHDLSASPAATGQAVSLFAAVYALAAPAAVRLLRRAPARTVLLAALALFAAANAAAALAASLAALLAARAVAALAAGVFTPTAAAAAGDAAPPRGRGRALATVVGGASLATAVGVPLGTLTGAWLGWRAAFAALALLALVVGGGLWGASPRAARRSQAGATRGIVPVLAVTVLWALGSFTVFTYVALVLRRGAGVGGAGLAGYLALFGLAGLAGAAASGRWCDSRGPLPVLAAGLLASAVALAGLGAVCTATPGGAVGAGTSAAAIALYGAGTWAVTPPQQERLLAAGGGRLALALNSSALYAGVALGGACGGALLARGGGASGLCWLAAGLELAAACLVAATRRIAQPGRA